MSGNMIEHLRHMIESGRKYNAASYNISKPDMESTVRYMEADLAEINRLREYLQMSRTRDVK